jgi:hypothetical protein
MVVIGLLVIPRSAVGSLAHGAAEYYGRKPYLKISALVERHPTVKMLALSFLLLIGVTLIAEGFGQHISKGYVYFAMAFSVFVEALNLAARKGPALT